MLNREYCQIWQNFRRNAAKADCSFTFANTYMGIVIHCGLNSQHNVTKMRFFRNMQQEKIKTQPVIMVLVSHKPAARFFGSIRRRAKVWKNGFVRFGRLRSHLCSSRRPPMQFCGATRIKTATLQPRVGHVVGTSSCTETVLLWYSNISCGWKIIEV